MTQPTLTLQMLMDAVRQDVLRQASEGELDGQYVYLTNGRSISTYRVTLDVPVEALPAFVRAKIAEDGPGIQHAIVAVEAWHARGRKDDPIVVNLLARQAHPRDWPADYRGELLHIVAESVQGFSVREDYEIQPGPEGRRTLHRLGPTEWRVANLPRDFFPAPARSPN